MMKDGATVQIPVCLNVGSLSVADASIQSAIIVIHGSSRNAVASYNAVETVVRDVERRDVVVIAPQFLTALDLRSRDPQPDVTIWRSSGWSQGDRSDAVSPGDRVSSFEVLDRLVEEISIQERYPNLKQITVAGHSAGGQFVQRYAAGTRIEQSAEIASRQLVFRYVVANPSSYLYLFPREPDSLSQRCSGFDEYKYGLSDLNAYLLPVGADAIRASYAHQDVIVLLGRLDYQMLDPSKDDSCPAVVQGAHRLSRGIRFLQHLDRNYGPGQHGTRLVVVPDVGHNGRAMFTSPEGRAALLGE
jgi:pimeloyl-ACP methyl ester carboxylesterase